MNGYVCFWDGKRSEEYAESSYAAVKKAVESFKKVAGRKKVKPHMVSVVLAEKNGVEVVHSPVF